MHQLVQRKERHVIKNILAYLELVRVLDPYAHLLEALIEPLQVFIDVGLRFHEIPPLIPEFTRIFTGCNPSPGQGSR